MEHVVHLGINIDDNAIREAVCKDAKNQIINSITQDVKNELGIKDSRWSRSNFADEVADKIIERLGEDIVNQTVASLIEKLPRRKWFREQVAGGVSE